MERLGNGETKVTGYRIKKGEKGPVFHERTYSKNETKEIWIYSLDDKDVFNVYGEGKAKIKVRLIGGQNKDTYDIKEGKKVTFYDYKSKESIVVTDNGKQRLTDDYETNVYDFEKVKNNVTSIIPTIGFNPDDGFNAGFSFKQTNYGFERNPFTSQHKFSAAYSFATSGIETYYSGEFANVLEHFNFNIEAAFNTESFTNNFFGLGNTTFNFNADDGDEFDLDFNRVKIQSFTVKPSLKWHGQLDGQFQFGVSFESHDVERTEGRFIANEFDVDNDIFDTQNFIGVEAKYYFENKDSKAFPTLGFQVGLETGYKNNTDSGDGFAYVIPEIGFDYKLIPSGNVVLATDFKGHVNFGDDFQFYQGASLGGDSGLRGFRNERFIGNSSFVQSTDVRWNFTDLKTNVIPIKLGVYAGLDYGRVWLDDESSNKWHNSYGGGFFLNATNLFTGNLSAFNSDEELRIAFKLGFGF